MKAIVEFVGAARTVTGSRHLVRTSRGTILLDCGLYQGRRAEARARNLHLGFDAEAVDAVVLSHAHIDHSGALPLLGKLGFRGDVHTTSATRDLCSVMLKDAAMIQAADARYLNREIERGTADAEPVAPLYDARDVDRVVKLMHPLPYHQSRPILPGVRLTFLDAGHVLGSAITVLDIDDVGGPKRLVFTGDLGRRHLPILRDPEVPANAHALIMESTYGNRLHPPIEEMDEELAAVVCRTHARRGTVVIPSFALERAQEILFSLRKLRSANKIPPMPVFVDSPLATNITEVFRKHPECLDEDALKLPGHGGNLFDFEGLSYTSSVADSIAITKLHEPKIIIAASGMCEAGRVLHHLAATVEDEHNTVVIVGFQAQHTLGRRLVELRSRVRIFGVERARRAEVVVLNGFSAHADQNDLLAFAENVRARGTLESVALVHGDPEPQNVLAGLLRSRGFANVVTPAQGDRMDVSHD